MAKELFTTLKIEIIKLNGVVVTTASNTEPPETTEGQFVEIPIDNNPNNGSWG